METDWEESEPKRPKRTDAVPSNSNDERPPPARGAQPSPSPPLMLLLVGLPGAGKSTFAETILSHSSQPWVRICQDTIHRGRRGSREQCISAAETVLQSKSNVIIDRTNLTPDQRSQFVRLSRRAGAGGRVHCVFFDLPTRDCGARASKRELHEGGVNGKGAFAVVGRLSKELQAAGPPQAEKEGLASLIICRNDADSNAAAHVWSSYVAPVQAPGDAFDPVTPWEQQRSRLRALAADASTAGSEERNEEERKKSLASAMQTKNAFNVMMAAAAAASQRQRDVSGSGDSSRGAHGVHQTGDPADEASPSRHRFAASPFLEALQDLANHPER
jgi:adenylate kinase family enzyme